MDKQEISETKSSLTKKQNSQTLARWIRKKKKKRRRRLKLPKSDMKLGQYYQFHRNKISMKILWVYDSRLDNLDEMVQFLETLCLPKQNYKEIENNLDLYVVSSIILQLRETKVPWRNGWF